MLHAPGKFQTPNPKSPAVELWCLVLGAFPRLLCLTLLVLILFPYRGLALDDEVTETMTISAGSYIVDMGVTSQTLANGLKPYGMVYDLVVNYRVPVLWSINPAKAKDGIDFTFNSKDYKGGPFIIRAEHVTTTVSNVIRSWKTLGVQVDGPIASAATSVPIYDTINALAKLALDTDNGDIAADYLLNASIPSSAYSLKLPSALGSCDDIYVMPHADPTWGTHGNLVSFAQSGGYVWGACHAVGVLENIDDPGDMDTAPNMNFLSVNGLVDYGTHDDGSPPFTYNSSYDPAPIAQFIGILDSATQSGSQQIYLPATGGWRPTTKVYVYDPSHADVPGLSPGEAAVLVYGRAFGNSSYGRVMYEGGHDHNKALTAPYIAAQRAFLNFYFLSSIDRRVEPSASVPAVIVEQLATNISVSASGGSGSYTYNWSSSIGGTFGNSNSASTTFTPPNVATNTPAVLTVTASDSCGRVTVHTTNFTVQYIPTSDMSVTATDSQDPAAAGGSFNYVLSVVNAGGDPATNVVVRNTLPSGATYSTASGSGWSCNHSAGVVTCTRSTLSTNVGSPSTITIGVTATNIPITLTNTASVISTNFDHTMSNNTNSTTTTVINGIDLALAKIGSTNGYAGISLPYTLTVTNKTPAGVTNVIIADVLPSTLEYGGASGSGWSAYYDAGSRQVTLILATLGANAASTVTLSVIPNTNAVGTTVTNTATVTSATPDPDSSNNSSSQATSISEAADLELRKTVLVDEGSNPDSFTYTVTLVNNGPATATNIVVTDVLTYITRPYYSNATATVGTFTPSGTPAGTTGGIWAITNLASGAEATLTLRYGTNSNSSFTNTASVTASQYDPDSSNNSDRAIGDKDFKQIDFGILKTDSPDPVGAGSNITYTITVTNTSTGDDWNGGPKTNTVVDTLPAGTTYVSASGTDWTCSHSSGVVTCFYTKDIGKKKAVSFTIVVTAPSVPGTITNTATMSYVRPNTEDPNSANDSVSAATTVSANVDLSVAKSVNNSTPDLNSNVTFTVTVSNLRSNAATNVRITDALPSGLSYVSDSETLGYYSSSDGYWYVGTLNVGASATLTLVAQVTSIGAKTNTATLSALTQTDTNSANDSASAIVTPRYADLSLAKTASTTTPSVNSNVTFTITVTNLGPSVGTNLTISDVLPEYLDYVSHSAGSGTYTSGTGLWTIPTLASNATATLTLTARVGNWGWLTNTATVTGVTPADPVSANNTASVGVDGQLVDLDPSKTVDNARPLGLGSNLVFTIDVTNRGPSTASNLELTDVLPTGLGYVSSSVSQGTYTPGTGKWAVGTLASNAYATLTLTATNSALGKLTNSVAITAVSQTITNTSDDKPSVVIYSGGEADLYVTKYVDNDEPNQGDVVTFTVSLVNYGPDSATGVIIRDVIPAGLTYLTNSAPAGTTYTTNAGDWTVGTITNGQTLELTISAQVMGTGQIDNTASVHLSNAADSDPIGNSATASITATPAADLIVFKSGATNVYAGSNLTYTITLTNAGLSSATNAILTDTLPTGATFVSASGGGSHSSGVVTWPTLAVFTNAATTNVTVTIIAPGNGPLTNYASATSSTTDTNSANNNGSATASRVITTVTPIADLVVAKSGSDGMLAGNNLTYTIAVTNLGPSIASNVVVSDLLPTNTTFVSASGGGTNGNGTVWWPAITSFTSGATTNFTVTITTPLSIRSLTNIARGTSDTLDPAAGNNDGTAPEARVITSVTGVTVSGFVYLDANHNLLKDASEAGTALTLHAKIFATTNAAGPAWQAVSVDGASGAYAFTNVIRGAYYIVIDDNNTLADVTPAIPAGWTGTEMPAQTRTNVAVSTFDLPNQNFGLHHGPGLGGRVFKDDGAGGGTANDGVANGSESGIGGVAVRLTDVTGGTTYDTATTDGSGNYSLLVPSSVTNGAVLRIVEVNPPAHLSTGAGVGNTGGSYARTADTITFTYTSGASYSGVNFGDVPENSFVNDSQQANLPGTFVLHPHSFTAGSGGSLSFSVASLPNPSISGWTQVIYRDANCNGQLDPGETAVTGAIAVSAGDKVCILIKEFIPGIAPFNAQDQLTVTAAFTWTGASPALSTNTTRIDLTTVGNPTTAGLTLLKAVDKETALPGEVLTYTVTYANHSSAALTNIVIFDQTPAFTTFSSAGHGALPNTVTGIAVTSPGVGATGAIKWTFTGSLAPASASTVTFSVTVSQ
jgi:uncharacterized repeat protein (TIGR01451 family)